MTKTLSMPQASFKLGTNINPLTKKVTFSIWAPSAKSVVLQFFKDGSTKSIYQEHNLTLLYLAKKQDRSYIKDDIIYKDKIYFDIDELIRDVINK